ncbi:MAG TPA: hypothetical protein DHW71_03535 [Gammaproteobacteria bacterium]|nr:hypothetical protein [Gammaproteobacteria bacterium]MEC8010017.1 hypothetical protein [Pseudomonadota bacterium]HBF10140.1 hypothetical protein [Gammaproteobacteria bacterium]HCK92031.1 hypothetical protein [Gammaproteobacteria bacterium]|tara:strand:- start:13660 stop:14490 length:831 start_codon:yes stop_codon:yes gene_type:complete
MAGPIRFQCYINPRTISAPLKEALTDLPRIASLVEKDTGWSLSGTLPVRVTDRNSIAQSMREDLQKRVMPVLRYSDSKEVTQSKIADIKTLNKFMPKTWVLKLGASLVMGAYLCGKKEVVIPNSSRHHRLTADYYRSVLYHELIHVAQDQRHPALFDHVNGMSREIMKEPEARLLNRSKWKDMTSKLNSCMTIVEGQPFYLQKIHDKQYFPNKNKFIGFRNMLIKAIFTLIPDTKKKLDQYGSGADFFKLHSAQSPVVDEFFQPQIAETRFAKVSG